MDLGSRDLGHFAEAVSAVERTSGFGLADIAEVPAAWESIDGNVHAFGWIVALRLGGRCYLRYTVDKAADAPPEIAVTHLAGDRPLPPGRRAVHWFEPDTVNKALRQHQALLATLLNNLP